MATLLFTYLYKVQKISLGKAFLMAFPVGILLDLTIAISVIRLIKNLLN